MTPQSITLVLYLVAPTPGLCPFIRYLWVFVSLGSIVTRPAMLDKWLRPWFLEILKSVSDWRFPDRPAEQIHMHWKACLGSPRLQKQYAIYNMLLGLPSWSVDHKITSLVYFLTWQISSLNTPSRQKQMEKRWGREDIRGKMKSIHFSPWFEMKLRNRLRNMLSTQDPPPFQNIKDTRRCQPPCSSSKALQICA